VSSEDLIDIRSLSLIGSKLYHELPRLTLILGGARSGKSAFAEKLIAGTGLPRILIATAEAGDAEMAARIARHKADRGEGWQTIEAPLDAAGALYALPSPAAALMDCATLWLSNHLLAGHDIAAETERLARTLGHCTGPVVVVSNEVGLGIVPDNTLARAFRDAQGRLNQRLAHEAGLVIGVMAGLPFALKGQLPA
jgi:adenosylcobinamide kinase/adenosylcobinamide-phosphate guanylyltransferase